MSEFAKAWLILISATALVVVPYVLAWRAKGSAVRRGATWIVALISALCAVAASNYVPIGLEDFHSPAASFWTALKGNPIMLAISIGAWVMAIRFSIIALRKNPSHRTSDNAGAKSR